MKNTKTKDSNLFSSWNFDKTNYVLFGIGMLVIAIGYLIMVTGETTSFQSVKLAPIVLIIGYCGIIPLSIWYEPKK
ncbi:MAG: DUF3098 domain-containing protein [Fidelibacterota bacterium]